MIRELTVIRRKIESSRRNLIFADVFSGTFPLFISPQSAIKPFFGGCYITVPTENQLEKKCFIDLNNGAFLNRILFKITTTSSPA